MTPHPNPRRLPALAAVLTASLVSNLAADWPAFRGAHRDATATSPPPTPLSQLEESQITPLWQVPLGAGFAGPVVSGNHVIAFHRSGPTAHVDAYDTTTGQRLWRHAYPCDYRDDFGFDPGPRSAPTVAAGKVFTYGPDGRLDAVDLSTGKPLWHRDFATEFGAPKGFFGRCGAPLVVGDHLLLNTGGSNGGRPAGIVALDTASGQTVWQATDHDPSYSSPVLLDPLRPGSPALFFTREGFVGIDPQSGTVFFEEPFRSSIDASVNAASPLVCDGGHVFLSACYGVGARRWRVDPTNPANPETVWAREGALDAHYATPVFDGGFIYGFHGRQESGTELRCIDARTGEVRWSDDLLNNGQLILVGNSLVILTEDGELAAASASPQGLHIHWRKQVLRRGVRCVPAFSNGVLYARDPKNLVAVDLRGK